MTPTEVARNAATLIEEHGLAKRTLQDADGSMCIRGAVLQTIMGNVYGAYSASTEDKALWLETEEKIAEVIEAEYGFNTKYNTYLIGKVYNTHAWNNQEHITAGDVINVLNKVAAGDRELVAA